MTKRLLIGFLATTGLLFVISQQALAHVLIRDDSSTIGAVLHVVPDDDPIAGETADLYFDIQTGAIDEDSAQLTITSDADGAISTVPIEVGGSGVRAEFTFPTQGTYRLLLTVTSDKTYVFSYAQRVSRGAAGSALDKTAYPLAQAALIFSSIACLFLIIIAFNRRTEIKQQSTF